MINGSISLTRQAVLPVPILNNSNRQFVALDFIIDTGFSGDLQLPIRDIERLNLSFIDRLNTELADGRVVRADVFEATVLWLDNQETIKVISSEANIPLIGTNLLWGGTMSVEWEFGGRVTVAPLPQRE